MADYGMTLTSVGAAKLAVALAGGAPVALTQMAFGDSNGTAYTPTGGETGLKHETARVAVETLQQDPQNPPWARVTGVLPAAIGGFFIREIGVYDAAGDLFAVGRYPDTYKPVIAQGAAFDAPVTVILQVGSVSAVTIVLDASTVFATREWVLTNVDFLAVKSATLTTPPGSLTIGDKWLVPATGGSGDWSGKGGLVAIYRGATDGWLFANPAVGANAGVADTGLVYRRALAGWRSQMAALGEHLAGADATLTTNPAGVAAMIAARVPTHFFSLI